MTPTELRAAILVELAKGPRTSQELRAATGETRQYLANAVKHLLRSGGISRQEISMGRWRYYIGDTAPKWAGYVPDYRKPKPVPKHAIPVRQMEFPTESGRTNRVSVPMPPWEVAA